MTVSTTAESHKLSCSFSNFGDRYTSPNYEITKLFFRSLEPWLRGELKPAHPEHWQVRAEKVLRPTILLSSPPIFKTPSIFC